MAKDRMYGEDKAFLEWCRKNPLLPTQDDFCGIAITDVDFCIHRFKSDVDGTGTRKVQSMMEVEVKTRCGKVSPSQEDTLRKKHLCTKPEIQLNGQTIQNYGVAILRVNGTTPEDSTQMIWCRFDPKPPHALLRSWVTVDELTAFLRFDRHPDSASFVLP